MAIDMRGHFSEQAALPSSTDQDFGIAAQPEMPPLVRSGGSRSYALAVSSPHLAATSADIASKPASIAAPLGGAPKRAMDIAIALSAIVLLSPLMIVLVGLIRLVMGPSVFFAHSRIGFRGRPFHCYKFRTMVADAEKVLAQHLAADPLAAQEWRQTRKLRNDPRVTLLGYVLRKSSLDELPQLFNVLRGDMSCVGPRPIVADELLRYGPHADEYLRVRPGLTGLWQVSGRNALDYSVRVALDSHYVRNWSMGADLIILCRTIFAVLNFDEAA
jgi:exopolysaccharide production protein ExoY